MSNNENPQEEKKNFFCFEISNDLLLDMYCDCNHGIDGGRRRRKQTLSSSLLLLQYGVSNIYPDTEWLSVVLVHCLWIDMCTFTILSLLFTYVYEQLYIFVSHISKMIITFSCTLPHIKLLHNASKTSMCVWLFCTAIPYSTHQPN